MSHCSNITITGDNSNCQTSSALLKSMHAHCVLKLLKFNYELLGYVERKDQKGLMLATVSVLFTQVAQNS